MIGFTVTRMHARGRDRVMVARADGTELGWIDVETGCLTVSPGGDAELVDLAVRAWSRHEGLPIPSMDPPDDPARILSAAPGPAEAPAPMLHTGGTGDDTAARLDRLTDLGWQVLHAVTFGPSASRLDHLLVGPGGVYTVTTRHHHGRRVWIGPEDVLVDGRPEDHLLDSRADADIAGRLLSDALGTDIEVRPTLVIVAGAVGSGLTFLQPPADVAVLRPLDLPDHFERRAGHLTDAQIQAIARAARSPATWH